MYHGVSNKHSEGQRRTCIIYTHDGPGKEEESKGVSCEIVSLSKRGLDCEAVPINEN